MRYTWGMHQYLRRLWRQRPPRVRVEVEHEATLVAPLLRPARKGEPLPYQPEPIDQDAPGWGPRPFAKDA